MSADLAVNYKQSNGKHTMQVVGLFAAITVTGEPDGTASVRVHSLGSDGYGMRDEIYVIVSYGIFWSGTKPLPEMATYIDRRLLGLARERLAAVEPEAEPCT